MGKLKILIKDFSAELNVEPKQVVSIPLMGAQWAVILAATSIAIELSKKADPVATLAIVSASHKLLEKLDPQVARDLIAHIDKTDK